jgi:hypothetical protein
MSTLALEATFSFRCIYSLIVNVHSVHFNISFFRVINLAGLVVQYDDSSSAM